ncbi:MAG: helix-turn-helix transcriptional regulator, partial [Oscillospiraceae bacterium]|nr:helix-turn-helix transcriptional regulator [Oscillospiraceae bacterium]
METMNIYRNARQVSGLTQERWAEALGLSAEAVRQYEAGKILPSDEVVLRMA